MTNLRPSSLPDFDSPPVVETALSVQFDRLTSASTAHFGMYWSEIYAQFPKAEERGELPPVIEMPPSQQATPGVRFQFEATDAPPTPRFLFANASQTELIQIQKDRFIKNWRKSGDKALYPRYESVRKGFDQDFSIFRDFVKRHDLGEIRVKQCEVTYSNHIVSGQGWDTYADVSKVFTVWNQPESSFPGSAQDMIFRARFPILDQSGNFAGRLHVSLQPAVRPLDGLPMFLLELTARGQIGTDMDFFDLGREWIVRSFKGITTPAMHQIWGIRS